MKVLIECLYTPPTNITWNKVSTLKIWRHLCPQQATEFMLSCTFFLLVTIFSMILPWENRILLYRHFHFDSAFFCLCQVYIHQKKKKKTQQYGCWQYKENNIVQVVWVDTINRCGRKTSNLTKQHGFVALMGIECSEVFLGNQPCQHGMNSQCLRDCMYYYHQALMWWVMQLLLTDMQTITCAHTHANTQLVEPMSDSQPKDE